MGDPLISPNSNYSEIKEALLASLCIEDRRKIEIINYLENSKKACMSKPTNRARTQRKL